MISTPLAASSGRVAILAYSAVAILAACWLSRALGLEASFLLWGLGALALFCVALVVGRVSPVTLGNGILFIALGIALGTMLDAILAETLMGLSRNMWPFDIAFWWVLGSVPVALGLTLGRILRSRVAT